MQYINYTHVYQYAVFLDTTLNVAFTVGMMGKGEEEVSYYGEEMREREKREREKRERERERERRERERERTLNVPGTRTMGEEKWIINP